MYDHLLKGKPIVAGVAEGFALVTRETMQFLGTIDYTTGVILAPPYHSLKGECITGKIIVFSSEVGSTAEPFGYYLLQRYGTGPKAIICRTLGQMPIVCSMIGNTPFVYGLEKDPIEYINTGDYVKVDGNNGLVEITHM